MRAKVWAAFIVTAVVVLGAAGVAPGVRGAGVAPTAGGASEVDVRTVDLYGYQPAYFQEVATGTNVTVSLTDTTVLPHSFTISSREGYVIPTDYTTDQLNQFFVTYPAIFSIFENTSGATAVGSFHSPASPGWYEFVCLIPGHFQLGMYGFIAFGEDLPANLTGPVRTGVGGTSLSLVDAVVIGILLLLIVVGLVLWFRQRSKPPPSSVRESAADARAHRSWP